MTTLPPIYLRLSPAWLERNPLPKDAYGQKNTMPSGGWFESLWRGQMLPQWAVEEYTYVTARTDLPKEAYLNKTEPAPDLTQAELPKADLTQPGAEVASERAEAKRASDALMRHAVAVGEYGPVGSQSVPDALRIMRGDIKELHWQVRKLGETRDSLTTERDAAIARAETAERDLAKTKERGCGCVKCVCEDEEQCQGCGATECRYHNQLRRGLERDLAKAREERDAWCASFRKINVKLINLLHAHGTGETEFKDGEKIDEMVARIVADRDRLAERVRELEKGLLHQRGGLMIVRDRQGGMASVEDINVGIKHIDDLLTPPATKSGNVSDCPNCNDTGWVCGVGESVPCPQCTPPASPAVNPSRPEPVKAGECPICGALEVEANHPRTFYACGSSDYDQRPGTFIQSARCVSPIAPEGKATEGERE